MLALSTAALWPARDALAQSRSAPGFVRLEAIESKAAPNDQPAAVSADVLRAALASVRIGGEPSRPGPAVFDDKELAEVAPGIAAALGRAGTTQDVTFAVFGHHGMLGENSPATVTTGRVFVKGGQLNVIFGRLQARYEEIGFTGNIELTPGQRARPLGQVWGLSGDSARNVDKRSDWLQFNLAQLAAKPQPAEAAKAPALAPAPITAATAPRPAAEASPAKTDPADARYQEIQARLKTLERLKAEGLISEEEYRERRRVILQSL